MEASGQEKVISGASLNSGRFGVYSRLGWHARSPFSVWLNIAVVVHLSEQLMIRCHVVFICGVWINSNARLRKEQLCNNRMAICEYLRKRRRAIVDVQTIYIYAQLVTK